MSRFKSERSSVKYRLLSLILIFTAGYCLGVHRGEVRPLADRAVAEVKVRFGRLRMTGDGQTSDDGAASARLRPTETVKSEYDNLSFGVPGKADAVVDREGYALGYIERHEQPAWVCYRLTRKEAVTKAAGRGDDFREDPAIPTGSATPADYRRSGYDRGHLAPAADMAWSAKTMSESFFMSNMSPQKPAFNRGVWKDLEEQVRQFAISEEEIIVVTGPVLPAVKTAAIGANKVTVPSHYYKVVYDLTPPQKMIGFILPNEGSRKPPRSFAVTVDAVEQTTGLDFFPLVPQPQQEQMERTVSEDAWKWRKP